jgi:hypothetical protein
MEGMGYGLFEILSLQFSLGIEENYEILVRVIDVRAEI